MRIKLLIFPAVLAAAIVIAIAYVWPELGDLRSSFKSLDESKGVLGTVVQKNRNIDNLKSGLDQNQEKENFVRSYLPADKNEERIINGINYLAANSGTSLVNISMTKEESHLPVAPAPAPVASGSKEIIFSGAQDASGSLANAMQSRQVKFVKIKANVAGTYENIKSFLEQIHQMEMFNSVASLVISNGEKSEGQPPSGEQAGASGPGVLSAELEIEFGYLPQVRIYNKDYSDPIFSQTSLDFASYDKLTNLVSKKIPAIEAGTEGRANPFLP